MGICLCGFGESYTKLKVGFGDLVSRALGARDDRPIVAQYVVGDTLPTIIGVLEETDITGYSITLRLKRTDGTTLVKIATLTTPLQGKFTVAFLAADLQAGYNQEGQLIFTNGAAVQSSEAFVIDVRPLL